MQKLVLFYFVLTATPVVLAQSKKEQIKQLNLQADSLKNVIDNDLKTILNYQLQIEQLQLEIKQHQIHSKNSIAELNQTILQLTDSLKNTKEQLSKYTEFRIFPNGIFSKQQADFIVGYFTNKLKILEPSDVVINEVNGEIVIQKKGELGYVPFYKFTHSYNPKFAGDLDKDGSFEILFQVVKSLGGSYEWIEFYCLKFVPNSSYVLIELGIECPCSFSCGESFFPEMVSSYSNKLNLKIPCYDKDDGLCCPSSEIEATYEFKNNQLFLNKQP